MIAPNLRVLFVGINPGVYSTARQHHFARPGNRFWPALASAGLTPHQLSPAEDRTLLSLGFGITNVVARTTARADELSLDELRAGARDLESKLRHFRPAVVAILGITAYRSAFDRPTASLGLQPDPLAGVRLFVLPNPSGLNAHHQLPALARLFAEVIEPP